MTATDVVVITISSLSLIASAATFTVVWVGSKKAQREIELVRTKTNKTLSGFKAALDQLEV